jgi:hypothetical protein
MARHSSHRRANARARRRCDSQRGQTTPASFTRCRWSALRVRWVGATLRRAGEVVVERNGCRSGKRAHLHRRTTTNTIFGRNDGNCMRRRRGRRRGQDHARRTGHVLFFGRELGGLGGRLCSGFGGGLGRGRRRRSRGQQQRRRPRAQTAARTRISTADAAACSRALVAVSCATPCPLASAGSLARRASSCAIPRV